MASKAFLRALILFGILFSPFSSPAAQEQNTWYVQVSGSDLTGRGTADAPFATVQHAIDVAENGDIVIVQPGRYTGPGNRDLAFRGKAITVRSQNPEDMSIVQETVLDAEGQGVIARFLQNEGPETVFSGFTLVAGDQSKPVRGAAGFFEFSPGARPRTEHLRVGGEAPALQTQAVPGPATQTDLYGRIWNGLDPFHQTFPTTNYYGSGDVNADGTLTAEDASLAREMAAGTRAAVHRADVDGNGVIDLADADRIEAALEGGYLPAWWNSLTDRSERDAWVARMLALDRTDQHIYDLNWWVCAQFATQLHIYGVGLRDELYFSAYDGGQTWYNLPIYYVSVHAVGFGHAINAILVGDDPQNFDDWRFIEPQTDEDVKPGMWDMPYGSTVYIYTFRTFGSVSSALSDHIAFRVDQSGWRSLGASPDFQLERTPPPQFIPDNRPDLWNPTLIPGGDGLLLFERPREALRPVTDIFIADVEIPFAGAANGKPLYLSEQVSRLLDVARGPDGTIHLLWEGKPDDVPGVFYATLNTATREAENMMRVSTETSSWTRDGRLVITPDGRLHAFWFNMLPANIYWSRLLDTGWQEKQALAYDFQFYNDAAGHNRRDFGRFQFDAVALADGQLMLVWEESAAPTEDNNIYYRLFDSSWGEPVYLEQTNSRGLALATSGDGKTHLIYWLGPLQVDWGDYEGRGQLAGRTFDGRAWSDRLIIDDRGGACCPKITTGDEGNLIMAWDQKEGDQSAPYWSQYIQGDWSEPQALTSPSGSDAWYPAGKYLPGGKAIFVWSARSTSLVTIETAEVQIVSELPVTIEVWPKQKSHLINIKSRSNVPVTILSTSGFDAPGLIDWSSLTFGRSGDEDSLHWPKHEGVPACAASDTNRDGQTDLICEFEIPKTGFQCGDTVGILRGKTIDGTLIEGWDEVLIQPCH